MATALEYSLKFIHLYPKTEQELRTKLFTKHYTEDEIDEAMSFLKSKKYVDDVQFTELYIQSEIVKKGKVPALVKSKLLHKGIDQEIIDTAMQKRWHDINTGIIQRIQKEIEKYKKRWLEWYDIIVKISQKWYRTSDIKKAIEWASSE
jgi:SOS response regulatory protein OraA/RecX